MHRSGPDVSAMTPAVLSEEAHVVGENAIDVRGDFGTKIEATVRRVLWLTSIDRGVKILVFSEWVDVLKITAVALRENGVTCVGPDHFEKSRAAFTHKSLDVPSGAMNSADDDDHNDNNKNNTAAAFDAGSAVTVFLMPLRKGSNGLNLTVATHVILIEPVLDPGTERQAVKRVDRMGQTKPTIVHRLGVMDTVEENVFALAKSRRRHGGGGGEGGGGGGGTAVGGAARSGAL